MPNHDATIHWQLADGEAFTDNRYSRNHSWSFDGGSVVIASASPSVVPVPMSSPAAVDPEEAFVASVSSCHMLWFLSIAAKRGFVVTAYTDAARGTMARNANGKMAITRIDLSPDARFGGDRVPSDDEITAMHHAAHEECFIAHSILAEVVCTPVTR
ncbi:MAG: OsmC family protein [Dokdonella sp.]|jgi:organic hydroperoxide reductase OsmC/OhrA|uniref:OsmC family protein n=1 Tax=Dokdonella sp. TaxID=2291710 RepID=UPI001B496774|nr:OsmC family protein [Dokdonella sp.]MBK8124876.1 OsmC family protein [Dokdonella sp.]MBP6327859.1 OsmC family protein [Dokdonella sp.]HNV08418.1 OsmC family protein [Dokdonella sp.]HPW03019.1 OsmC family protein [Dokdonella sp.]